MSEAKPFFSVITPVYNRAKILHETVDTVLAQEFKDFELILIDDKSTDASLDIIKDYATRDERVRYVALETNKGRCIARNSGIEAARAEWICFLDSDDFYYPNHLSTLKMMIGENPGQLAFATEQTWDRKPKPYNKRRFKKEKVWFHFRDFIGSNPVSPNQLCYHRSVPVRWVNERLPISEDWLFHRQLSLRTSILKYLILTTDVRIHDERSLDTYDVDAFIDWNIHAAKKFVELEKDLPAKWKNSVMAFTYVLAANVLYSKKKRKRAVSCFRESLKYPQSLKYLLFYKAIIKLIMP